MTGLAAPALAFVAAGLAAAGLGLLLPPRMLRRGRARGESGGYGNRTGARIMRLLAAAGARLRPAGGPPQDLAARIAAAGQPGGLGPREVMGAKLAAALVGGTGGMALGAVLPGRLGIASALVGPVAGFLAPDGWLARRAGERSRRVRRELPAMLDLLRVTVEAGLPLAAALAAVGERTEGPVGAEWRAVSREVSLGVPLEDALSAMAHRLPQPEVAALIGALVRAMHHGAPLVDTLAAQSRDARLARQRRIQEEAARAGPKIQLVVALLLVPSVLLLVAAALAAALLERGGGVTIA